ncbi:hypothetical protein [Cyclobacterium roseum]|uniref:hypothetical protein n=1 Tax=Cyclobacterium roseum TaxID=2666137 RepID=UPI0013911173|nr:hypothetical protein [Cyclobacterium roseum]
MLNDYPGLPLQETETGMVFFHGFPGDTPAGRLSSDHKTERFGPLLPETLRFQAFLAIFDSE